MPPNSIYSAFTLVSLGVLAAVEAGGCNKRSESLNSVTRSALPLLAKASGSTPIETNYALSDYGLGPHPELQHVCGHYELRADGRLTTRDLFATTAAPDLLRQAVERERQRTSMRSDRQSAPIEVNLTVNDTHQFVWPSSCPKTLTAKAQSVLVASRVL